MPGITCPKIAAIDEEEHSHLAQELWQESTRYEPVGKPGSGLVAGTLGSNGGQRIHLERKIAMWDAADCSWLDGLAPDFITLFQGNILALSIWNGGRTHGESSLLC